MTLTGKQRHYLRGLAHHLNPVVQVGQKGLTEAVLRQIDDALDTHELIKVRVSKDAPDGRPGAAEAIESKLSASVVQTVGRILVVYRRRDDEPGIELPRA